MSSADDIKIIADALGSRLGCTIGVDDSNGTHLVFGKTSGVDRGVCASVDRATTLRLMCGRNPKNIDLIIKVVTTKLERAGQRRSQVGGRQ